MSAPQANVIQKVSHPPRRPKYGFPSLAMLIKAKINGIFPRYPVECKPYQLLFILHAIMWSHPAEIWGSAIPRHDDPSIEPRDGVLCPCFVCSMQHSAIKMIDMRRAQVMKVDLGMIAR